MQTRTQSNTKTLVGMQQGEGGHIHKRTSTGPSGGCCCTDTHKQSYKTTHLLHLHSMKALSQRDMGSCCRLTENKNERLQRTTQEEPCSSSLVYAGASLQGQKEHIDGVLHSPTLEPH
jgi:hypothetical protein